MPLDMTQSFLPDLKQKLIHDLHWKLDIDQCEETAYQAILY